ncbi:MAG: rubrerythrin family protein [Magnetospirillum sp.]|nr:rubrerythrin family protein [Magnetospirillum sp.]
MAASVTQIATSADLLAIARAVAERSAERYGEMAEAFEMACNLDTAGAFRALAADQNAQAAALPAGTPVPPGSLDWFERLPEIADPDSVHYLMLPWHAHDLALRAAERAQAFFAQLAATAAGDVRDMAQDLAKRGQAQVEHLRAGRDACPEPHPGWWEDQDGPNWDAD